MDLRRFVTAVSLPFRRALTSRHARWWLFGSATVLGWVAIAGWMALSRDPGDDGALWALLLICGAVGLGQGLAILPLGTDSRTRGRKRKPANGTWLLRWWQVLLLAAAHILIVVVLAILLVNPDAADDAVFDAIFGVLFLGTLGWVVVPLVLFTAVVVLAIVLGMLVTGAWGIAAAARATDTAPLSRARSIAAGVAMIGGGIAVAALVAAIPFVSSGHATGSYKGAAIAAAVVLLLQAIGAVPSPDPWWYLVIRIAYLAGLLAVLQFATFRLWAPRVWRD